MARLLIPTRNRPASLAAVLGFLDRFYPNTDVIVADGSAEEFAAANMAAAGEGDRPGRIEYRRYPYDLPLFDRLLDVLRSIDDEFVAMGADDNYPLMDTLDRAETELRARDSAVSAMGPRLVLSLSAPDIYTATLGITRSIAAPSARQRGVNYSRWFFGTTHAVTRREHLVERFERARRVFFPGFHDYGVGLHDTLSGDVLAVPEFGSIVTRNFRHSYLRKDGPLTFVHHSDQLLMMLEDCAGDLERHAGLAPEAARSLAEDLFQRKIVGGVAHRRRGFEQQPLYRAQEIQTEIREFETVFTPGSATHERYRDRLRYILDAMARVVESTDNAGEPARTSTLAAQMQAGAEAQAAPVATDTGTDTDTDSETVAAPEPEGEAETPRRGGRRHLDPMNLSRRFDPERLAWREEEPPLHILVVGEPFGRVAPAVEIEAAPMVREGVLQTPPEGVEPIWPALAELCLRRLSARDIIMSFKLHAGTSVEEWADGEDGDAADALAARLSRSEVPPQWVVLTTGAQDVRFATPRSTCQSALATIERRLTRGMPDATVVLTRIGGDAPEAEAVREAQEAYAQASPFAVPGPILDPPGTDWRDALGAYNETGTAIAASLMFDALRPGLDAARLSRTALRPPLRRPGARAGERGQRGQRGQRGRRVRGQSAVV